MKKIKKPIQCEVCGRDILDLEKEKETFWYQLEGDIIDDAKEMVGWDFENTCWNCAYNLFMEEYYERHPDMLNSYRDDEERRFDPSKYPWCDD